jgi:hypothetical protein
MKGHKSTHGFGWHEVTRCAQTHDFGPAGRPHTRRWRCELAEAWTKVGWRLLSRPAIVRRSYCNVPFNKVWVWFIILAVANKDSTLTAPPFPIHCSIVFRSWKSPQFRVGRGRSRTCSLLNEQTLFWRASYASSSSPSDPVRR